MSLEYTNKKMYVKFFSFMNQIEFTIEKKGQNEHFEFIDFFKKSFGHSTDEFLKIELSIEDAKNLIKFLKEFVEQDKGILR